jgi:hypothetical protein
MHWKELLTTTELFRKYEPRATYYDSYIRDKNWAAWESGEVPTDEVERLFLFLKQWGMQFLPAGTQATTGFQQSYSKVHKLLKGIGEVKLETIDFYEQAGGGFSHIHVIAEIFDSIAYCFGNNKRESTAASKILHTAHPSLFVMWDSDICFRGYGLWGGGYQYANYFLPQMQKEALFAINEYAQEKHCNQTEAIEGITRLAEVLFFTKLLDEWNYCRFNQKMRKRIEDGEGKSLDAILLGYGAL